MKKIEKSDKKSNYFILNLLYRSESIKMMTERKFMKKPVSKFARIVKNVSISAAALVISSFGLVAVAAMGGVNSSLVGSGTSPFFSFLNGDQTPDQVADETSDVETVDTQEPEEIDEDGVDVEDQTDEVEDLDNQDEDLDEQVEADDQGEVDEQDVSIDEQTEDQDQYHVVITPDTEDHQNPAEAHDPQEEAD